MSSAAAFGASLQVAFRVVPPPTGEIALFRHLKSILTASHHASVQVEEYHGNSHQVYFQPRFSGSKRMRRCELADLAIVSYSRRGRERARITFLQAKNDRRRRTLPPTVSKLGWRVNTVQWDLLSGRPAIRGHRRFNPPSDLLSGAILPSVGSFGFFHHVGNTVDMAYTSADQLVL